MTGFVQMGHIYGHTKCCHTLVISENVGDLLIFRERVLYIMLKSVWGIEAGLPTLLF